MLSLRVTNDIGRECNLVCSSGLLAGLKSGCFPGCDWSFNDASDHQAVTVIRVFGCTSDSTVIHIRPNPHGIFCLEFGDGSCLKGGPV